MMNKKLVWAWLLSNGNVTDGSWKVAGYFVKYENVNPKNFNLFLHCKNAGIDWILVDMPAHSPLSEFIATDGDNISVDTIIGTIFLKNGEKFLVGGVLKTSDEWILDELAGNEKDNKEKYLKISGTI